MIRALALWLVLVSSAPAFGGESAQTASPTTSETHSFALLSDGQHLDFGPLDERIPSPAKVLGYELGSRFTPQGRILAYLDVLAKASGRVRMWEYGRTYEDRPLMLLAISSEENLAHLEEIRQRQLILANDPTLGQEEIEELLRSQPAVVWLAFGIHGNEPSSSEVVLAAAYALAAATGEWSRRLENLVVLIDPLMNPDGRERYVQAFTQRVSQQPDPLGIAWEHEEPWPGGRFNHYLVDLNRDWAWASQEETRARIAAYRRWEPQVYADFHEMSSESSYFFPPAAQPILSAIDPRTLGWLERFGRTNAAAFDRQGWLYYKSQNFDLFYPGYGDSYPALRGAVGMTFEVAGGGAGGLVLERKSGDVRSLTDRIERHFTTALTTLEVASEHRLELLRDFAATRRRAFAQNPRTFLWSPEAPEGQSLARLLETHGIDVGQLANDVRLQVSTFSESKPREIPLPRGTYAVSSAQPLGGLVRTLLEREAEMPAEFVREQRQRLEKNLQPKFYDITAWSLPLAFGIDAWVFEGEVAAEELEEAEPRVAPELRGEGRLGLLIQPQGLAGFRLAARLQSEGVRYRVAAAEVTAEGEVFPPGTLFIPQLDPSVEAPAEVEELLRDLGLSGRRLDSGYLPGKVSLGSDEMVAVRPPRIALVGGEGTSPPDHGDLWFLLDRLIGLSYSRLDLQQLSASRLEAFDVLILPDGDGYSGLDSELGESLVRWVRQGGFLVAVDGAVPWLRQLGLVSFQEWQPEAVADGGSRPPLTGALDTPGAALAAESSAGHPLVAFLPRPTAVLARGERVLLPSGDPRRDLLTAAGVEPVLSGFAWPEAADRLAGSLLIGLEPQERGRVLVFANDPAFRLFWRVTLPVLLQAALHGPSLAEAGFLD
ncbi:MAG: hypothetical protein KDD47_11360 [Acidobacteria bacterium]|nr:hypothetical protein [Acidobacteriota bacterium]